MGLLLLYFAPTLRDLPQHIHSLPCGNFPGYPLSCGCQLVPNCYARSATRLTMPHCPEHGWREILSPRKVVRIPAYEN